MINIGFVCVDNNTVCTFDIFYSLDLHKDSLFPMLHLLCFHQIRLASVRVVEAVSVWREDVKSARLQSLSKPTTFAQRHDSPKSGTGSGSNDDSNSVLDKTDMPTDRKRGKENRSDNGDGYFHEEKETHSHRDDPIQGYTLSDEQTQGDLRRDMDTAERVQNSRPQSTQRISKKRVRDTKVSRQAKGDGSGDDRRSIGASNGKWVVTMMVPGRKLWGSSPAMVSQYKRFRRSRQDPRIARDQVCLCVTTSALSRESFYEVI